LTDGGRYCAASCASPATWYQDHDADGFGTTSVQQIACDQPVGFVADASDCNDVDALAWGTPIEVAELHLSGAGPTELTWTDETALTGPGTFHDLVSGALGPTGGGALSSADCLQSSSTANFTDTRPGPSVGSGFWYLVRARNSCATATYGSGQRDSTIPVCP
jgi:hypothetical protein